MDNRNVQNKNNQPRNQAHRNNNDRAAQKGSDNRLNETKGAGADNTGKQRRDYNKDRNRNKKNWRSSKGRRSGGVETLADIRADITRIEKEIRLEQREIRDIRLGL